MRHFHAVFGVAVVAGIRWALIKSHDDVAANTTLDIHSAFGREKVLGAINMRLKGYALFFDLAPVCQGIYLITTTIGKDWPIPTVEFVQAARRFQHLCTRPQIKMVGITQNDLGTNIFLQLFKMHAFNRAYRTNGHKDRCLDLAVIRCHGSRSCFGAGVCIMEGKT